MPKNKDVALLIETLFRAKRPYNRTRIQKTVFLAKTEEKLPYTYQFSMHHHGPFSKELAKTVSSLTNNGILEETRKDYGHNVTEFTYRLTPVGIKLRENLVLTLSDNEKSKIAMLCEKYDKMSLTEIVSKTYSLILK